MKQNYFIIFDTAEGAYLCLTPDGNAILTYSTHKEARDVFELYYQECHEHNESITWSTSATLHWMILKPFVVALDASLSPVEVVNMLSNLAPDPTVYSLRSTVVRTIQGLKVDLNTCRQYEISQVRLIVEKAPAM
ncbi:MAG: hypothetical protein KME29_08875 [Calothrix sp. FI2-JRJ7]|jgi:hypothetical protein|nr:hypothetical protein [Calothrix sp. FI2-JRJ7]